MLNGYAEDSQRHNHPRLNGYAEDSQRHNQKKNIVKSEILFGHRPPWLKSIVTSITIQVEWLCR
jgi:hypothetical protein